MKIIEKHPLLSIVFLYIIANIFMLFNNGWYWDDWCLSTSEGIESISNGIGAPFLIPIHSGLINLTTHPALLYHILTGIFEILGIVIFYKCLLLLDLNHSNSNLLTLIFALLPYNQAKITLSCFMYTIGFFIFLLAILLFILNFRKKNLVSRIFSIILFFCSFMFLPSTLVLALAFFLLMAVLSQKQEIQFNLIYFKKIFLKLITWSDFILIPFIFWVFRAIFLKPTGIYATENYRDFSVSSVLLTPINLIVTFIQNFIGLGIVVNPLHMPHIYILMFVIVFVVLFFLIRKYKIEQLSNDKQMFYIGLYLFIAGAFAYLMVGLLPLFDGYNSRHQILLRFGSTFLLFYLINLINSVKPQKVIVITIFTLFIIFTISSQLQFQKSWFKQMALENAFRQEKLLGEGINFIVIDNTLDYNEFKYSEGYRFYCYTGILNKTFGTQSRFAIDSKELDIFDHYNPNDLINAINVTKGCKNITSISYLVIINKGNVLMSDIQNIKMLYQYYFNKVEFDKILNAIISVKILPYTAENKRIWNL